MVQKRFPSPKPSIGLQETEGQKPIRQFSRRLVPHLKYSSPKSLGSGICGSPLLGPSISGSTLLSSSISGSTLLDPTISSSTLLGSNIGDSKLLGSSIGDSTLPSTSTASFSTIPSPLPGKDREPQPSPPVRKDRRKTWFQRYVHDYDYETAAP